MISLICGILKNDTNELIYKTEVDSQDIENKRLPKGKGVGEGEIRSLELTDTHTTMYKIGKQQGPTA